MSVSEATARQLLREYFEDYNSSSRFIYVFGGEQFLVTECLTRSGGVSKSGIINLFNEYLGDYKAISNFIIDTQSCNFLIGSQTATFDKLPAGQERITQKEFYGQDSKSLHVSDENDSPYSGFGGGSLS